MSALCSCKSVSTGFVIAFSRRSLRGMIVTFVKYSLIGKRHFSIAPATELLGICGTCRRHFLIAVKISRETYWGITKLFKQEFVEFNASRFLLHLEKLDAIRRISEGVRRNHDGPFTMARRSNGCSCCRLNSAVDGDSKNCRFVSRRRTAYLTLIIAGNQILLASFRRQTSFA